MYVIEVGLRLSVHREYFFVNKNMCWNIFDFALVLQALIVQTMEFSIASKKNSHKYTFGRLTRLLKLGKIFRLFRAVKFLRDLRIMITGMVESMMTLLWSCVIFVFMFFVFSLIIVQYLGGYIVSQRNDNLQVDLVWLADMTDSFGTVSKGALTLFLCVFGGLDGVDVYKNLIPTGAVLPFTFVFFLFFFNLAIMNLVSAVFLDKALSGCQDGRDTLALQKMQQNLDDAEQLRILFNELDMRSSAWDGREYEERNADGLMSADQLRLLLQNDTVVAYFSTLDIEVKDVQVFFDMLEGSSSNGDIFIDDFVEACIRVKGHATRFDVAAVHLELKLMHR